jgi:hypothetical protein
VLNDRPICDGLTLELRKLINKKINDIKVGLRKEAKELGIFKVKLQMTSSFEDRYGKSD